MDFFEQIAREQVRAMILNHARREDLSQIFSQGEMRLLGCLNAGADGRTAGELSTLLDLSTARIAAMPTISSARAPSPAHATRPTAGASSCA